MPCADEALMHARARDAIDAGDRALIEAHLRDCPDCGERDARVRRGVELLKLATGVKPHVDWSRADDSVMNAVTKRIARRSMLRAPRWHLAGAIAAALVVAWMVWPTPPTPAIQEPVPVPIVVIEPAPLSPAEPPPPPVADAPPPKKEVRVAQRPRRSSVAVAEAQVLVEREHAQSRFLESQEHQRRAAVTPVATASLESRPGLKPPSAEALFLQRAAESLATARCGNFLLGLQDVVESSEDPAARESARILRARCYDDRLEPLKALEEYRKYLVQHPDGRFAKEARRAVEE